MSGSFRLERQIFGKDFTLGRLIYSDGEKTYGWWTCEDVVRGDGDPKTVGSWKVKDESAIPYGSYLCKLTWSPKYGKAMPLIYDVPGYDGIRIHPGNTKDDTSGCVCPGSTKDERLGHVLQSRKAFAEIYALMESEKEYPFVVCKAAGKGASGKVGPQGDPAGVRHDEPGNVPDSSLATVATVKAITEDVVQGIMFRPGHFYIMDIIKLGWKILRSSIHLRRA